MKRFFSFLLIFFVLTSGCGISFQPQSQIKIKGIGLNVEWARTEAEKIKGLQGRTSLGEDQGMIFDYGTEKPLTFWMKDTHIPLSIAFIDSKGVIKEIANMSPESLEPHHSKHNARYALEVNQGWFERKHIQPGDQIEL